MGQLGISLALIPFFVWPFSSLATIDEPKQVVIRGRVVCLDESGRRVAGDHEEKDSPHHFGFDRSDGKFYGFLSTDSATAMFTDLRVRRQQLQLTALLHPKDQLEIIKVQSIKDGKLFDLYYFCEVCNITAYAPGLCSCCRAELEFRETPAQEPQL